MNRKMNEKKRKLAIVASGGGMTCAYSAGAITAFVEKFKLKKPDIIIGGSGSIGTLAYYVAKQYKSIKNVWLNLLCNKNVIDIKIFWRVIDVDYVIDNIFKKQEKLNVKKLVKSEIKLFIGVTDYERGKVEYFSNKSKINLFEAIRASMAVPMLYNKPVRINNRDYCDSFASCSVQAGIRKAISLGAKEIIAVNTQKDMSWEEDGFKVWLFAKSKEFKINFQKEIDKIQSFKLPNGIKLVLIEPKERLKIGFLKNTKKMLRATFNRGYRETEKNKELLDFLSKK